MARHVSASTTRSVSRVVSRITGGVLLARDQVLTSSETGLAYRVGPLLGQGGFGEVYVARRRGRSHRVPQTVCIKVSAKLDGWVRESYFGRLLEGHTHAIQVYDQFPLPHPKRQFLYCLVLELAEHGDLGNYLRRTGKRFAERTVRRQMAGVLDVLATLHHRQLLHRDLTPFNVFVCDRGRLKIGDFGIARQQLDKRGVVARTLNPFGAPKEFLVGGVRRWQAKDDVFQVGQLLGMLLLGDASQRIDTRQVRHLPCSDHLKEVIHRCLGDRHRRYETAEELIAALRAPVEAFRPGALKTLDGVHLAFTGFFSRPRREVSALAKAAGAIVHGSPSARTSVVVRGRPNAQQAAGPDAGVKLMEVRRLRDKGHDIRVIRETQFWRLIEHA
jgi:serine/threonine protein kinase